jgi:hypothetical protein
MRRVLATETAVLAELEPLGRLLLVLRRAVIATFALAARQLNDVSHQCILVSSKFKVPSSKLRKAWRIEAPFVANLVVT